MSVDWKNFLDSTIIWAADKNYHVELNNGSDDCMCTKSKTIEINQSNDIEIQVYRLLHECGHVLIGKNGYIFDYIIPKEGSRPRVKRERAAIILREVEAWRRGYNLGLRLGVPINEAIWKKEMVEAILSYSEWVTKGVER